MTMRWADEREAVRAAPAALDHPTALPTTRSLPAAPLEIAPPTAPASTGAAPPRARIPAGADEAAWREIGAMATLQFYPAGIQLFPQEALLADAWFVKSGLLKLVRLEADGRELILGLRFPGALVGAADVIAGRPTQVAAHTLTGCQLLRVSAAAFREQVQTNPRLSWQIQEHHCHEIHGQMRQLMRLHGEPPRRRLAAFLRELIGASPVHTSARGVHLALPLKHWEVAGLIAITPEYLSRLLTQMEREGVIQRDRGWLIVPDLGRLHEA